MKQFNLFIIFMISMILSANAENQLTPDQIKAEVDRIKLTALDTFKEYLAIPNDGHMADDIAKLANWVENAFESRGFEVSRLAAPENPLLYAKRMVPGATKTMLVYLQADGQPVDLSAWYQPNPYGAVLRASDTNTWENGSWRDIPWDSLKGNINPDWRIYARSASDSKGPNTQFLMALDVLDNLGITTDFNLKVVIDTEEELSSPHLPQAVIDNRAELASDMLMIFDGPPHRSGGPTLSFGARGIAEITLQTFGAKVAQHSGHFGNYAPNPAFHMARILSSMKTADGVVSIPGFYKGVDISQEAQEILDAVPNNEAEMRAAMGFSIPDQVADSLEASIQYPSLNIRGLNSAWVGDQVRTIIPPLATAEIDVRLVKESDPVYLISIIKEHIEGLGYTIIDHEPTDMERAEQKRFVQLNYSISYPAFRTDFDSLAGNFAKSAMTHLNGSTPIMLRTMGGSIPISPFVDTLDIPALSVPTVNPDNNQHSPNENIRVGNFIDGIATIAAVLAERLE
ncbi:MAG: M20/M25/M40 family metallo-hydrolase [Kordiimonadaceae bacterium]|jgi:acetylornithine deacetylase/succinyl-diaminopimelate desuccinylase-like protein|nr:M20/M25/M40 family metallo-hydrolase [Kordiimonadaceae bacterium]MBT6034880.1 M20/M25/M40 family metallo-hydrolase [Kordiimonadaceae bacterium]MBT6329739.1 M20/M25/M40 family metallo-hydrolase [Kordiimonadaceae bacterium]